MSTMSMKAFTFVSDNLAEFESYAKRAKNSGATHVFISQMPQSFWMWERDFGNPYPNWSMHHCQLFKLVTPPGLEKYLPAQLTKECFELVKSRCEILDKLGLKAAMKSNEPFWLPEEAYIDNPRWRGPRCDHPRRSTTTIYSPCIDNEEILAMYHYAVKTLAENTNIELMTFKSNDCGGGICWSSGLYTGPNGPISCKNRSMGDRITGFVNALSDGAKAGGKDMLIHFDANLGFKEPEYQVDMVWPLIRDNQIVNNRDKSGTLPIASAATREGYLNPVKSVPLVMQFARNLDAAAATGRPVQIVQVPRSDLDECWEFLEKYAKAPSSGLASVIRLVEEAAASIVGEAQAGKLVDIWQHIDDTVTAITYLGLDMMQYGTLHQRWINRPFVPFPDELPPEHKDYYRRFQFQAQGEEHANDLLDIQGIEAIRGFSGVFLATEAIRRGRESLAKAIGGLNKLAGDVSDSSKLLLTAHRLRVLDHFMRCMANAARFQDIIDGTDFDVTPDTDCRWPTANDSRIQDMQNIMRDEIDNAIELADLLEGKVSQLVASDEDSAREDIFHYGPNLPEQLRLKAQIMLAHIIDLGRIYETNNI